MATAEFRATNVINRGEERVEEIKRELAAKHEENIEAMMAAPYGGFWPFTKPRMRSRKECEVQYGSGDSLQSRKWWAERISKGKIARVMAIVNLAKGTKSGAVRLNHDEAKLIGIAGE